QCNELNGAMPFLFEKVDDPTELLLPDNLLNTDSVIRQMVDEIPEEDWKKVEIIGWLYQFYISEKKDTLLKEKKAYKTEDIPAVTQLFTPNWIVKYLVQNSLGSKWLATYPVSSIKDKMEYYIEPAEQTDEVKHRLKEITPDSLNPEELTFMDPACGSGHILVEAYKLFKDIYLERGYRPKDIPSLILTKNLYGLEIDDRAAQLAGFALMMKARQDDRQIFEKQINPNILVLKSVTGRVQGRKESADIVRLIELFENASTFGSLIRIPEELILKLPSLKKELEHKRGDLSSHDVFTGAQYYEDLLNLVKQTELLCKRYDCVVANPPYMGSRYLNSTLKEYLREKYSGYEKDLFSSFIIRNRELSKDSGNLGFMSPFVWMFISSYEGLRSNLINRATLTSLIQLEYSGFAEATVPICTFTFKNTYLKNYAGSFIRLSDFRGSENQAPKTIEAIQNKKCGWFYVAKPDEFKIIPGSPIAYWVSETLRNIFLGNIVLKKIGDTRQGLATSDNNRFLRLWHEVSDNTACRTATTHEDALKSKKKWFPYNKGGDYRKWYGNNEFYINWENGGRALLDYASSLYGSPTRTIKSMSEYFKPCISWSKISSANLAMRYYSPGFLFDVAGCCIFSNKKDDLYYLLGYANTNMVRYMLRCISPTLNFEAGQIASLPIKKNRNYNVVSVVSELIKMAKKDWDSFETSWDFEGVPMLFKELKDSRSEESYLNWEKQCQNNIARMKNLEEENNKLFIESYGLQDELTPDVPEDQITLSRADKEDDFKRLVSFAIGCMMGRFSLDKPGLVYAHSGNVRFDSSQYKTFPADDDGIVPITDHEWFDDDAACRFFRFTETAWDKKGLDANLDFIADAIGRKASESSREAIRNYFVNNFYKDHCQTYKKRPIYWLFTSGKEKAFQALVYLHRYNEGTLSRMRTEYVLPLQTKINRHIEHLEKDKDSAASTSASNKIQKEISSLLKQKNELIKFDERLRHYADMKIKMDLDDGVKVNYEKFDDLLAKI
ncbi:MAG: BREX-1 system adenine-specific DNA-methyltransferase PglX, partial [Nanoarchaeota archaeon]|nr:BREX-1 system adenine-specific DNA-methyltransferase PglX [Nanoarchaeota archaeon]